MIRKILLCTSIAFMATFATAQVCTPDATLNTPGLRPNALPKAQLGVAYSQTITVRLLRDTTAVFGGATIPVSIDSMLLQSITGLPAGLTYQCLAPRCRFLPLQNTCIVITGTPTQSGTFPLKIATRTFARAGALAVPQNDTIRNFTIEVEGTNNLTKVSSTPHIYPQPAGNMLTVSNILSNQSIWVSDLTGKKLNISQILQGKDVILQLDNIPTGMYLLHYGHQSIKFIRE